METDSFPFQRQNWEDNSFKERSFRNRSNKSAGIAQTGLFFFPVLPNHILNIRAGCDFEIYLNNETYKYINCDNGIKKAYEFHKFDDFNPR